MMNNYQKEQLENIRRVCQKILDDKVNFYTLENGVMVNIDVFQHILDLVESIKEYESM